MKPLLKSLLSCVALILALAASPAARAQEEEGHLMEQAGPLAMPVSWRTLNQACKSIGFDESQMGVVKTLHQGYRASVKDSLSKGRKSQETLQKLVEGENPDWSKYQKEQGKIRAQFVKEMEAAEKALMTDVEAVCSPDQKTKFTAVQRARRRELGRVFTMAPGEGIDPPALLDSLKVTRTPAIDAAIAQWEESLDRILIERERLIRSLMGKEEEMADNPEKAQKEMKESFAAFKEMTQRVGDLNRRTAADLQSMLKPEQAEKLARTVRERTFPRIWGESKVTRAAKAAKARADITPEQKTKLDELLASYEKEAEPINTRWAAAADDKFRSLTADFLESMGMGQPQDDKEPFFAIRKERRALDDKYLEKVTEFLNQDQRDAAKKAEDSHEGRDFLPEFLPAIGEDFEASVKEWKGEEEP